MNQDHQIALILQKQFDMEMHTENPKNNLIYPDKKKRKHQNTDSTKSLVDPSWEVVDPTPDLHILFMAFNERFFWNKLLAVSVSWSKRMTTCAGICSYQYHGGLCKITLSEPLLKLRPRKDLVETLLHEMIHALLFVTHNNKDRDGHGPEFHKHMYRINSEAGTNISVYHDFHDEVRLYQQHWWRCNGPCQQRRPYYGFVRRAMNRAPGPNDRWWAEHQHTCGGKFIKVKEPEKTSKTKEKQNKAEKSKNVNDTTKFINKSTNNNSSNIKTITNINNSGLGTKNKNGTVILNPKTTKTNVINKENVPNKNGNIITIKDLETNNNVIHTPNSPIKVSDTLPNIDYTIVRNKWLTKFDNTNKPEAKRKNTENSSSNPKKLKAHYPEQNKSPVKAGQTTLKDFYPEYTSPKSSKSENSMPELKANKKIPKSIQPALTNFYPEQSTPKKVDKQHIQNDLEQSPIIIISDGVNCPVCNKLVPNSKLNDHLDVCLQNDSIDKPATNLQMVQCPSCNTFIDENNLNEHLDTCLNKNETNNKPTASNTSLTQCEICDKFVSDDDYALHTESCLNKLYNDIEKKYNLNTTSETTSCLVCNEDILKVDLETHLDTCMGKAFETKMKEEINDEEEEENKIQDGEIKVMEYNCPICLKPIEDTDMNKHIDDCLTINHFNDFDD